MTESRLVLVPVTRKEAMAFVSQHHRHNEALPGAVFCVGIALATDRPTDRPTLQGVAVVGIPKARMSCDGWTLEVNRTCTLGAKNANSMLYGACARAAAALGWRRLLTYTLLSESGVSLRAAGWTCLGEIDAGGSWQEKRGKGATQYDLFGERRMPLGPKLKWEKIL